MDDSGAASFVSIFSPLRCCAGEVVLPPIAEVSERGEIFDVSGLGVSLLFLVFFSASYVGV